MIWNNHHNTHKLIVHHVLQSIMKSYQSKSNQIRNNNQLNLHHFDCFILILEFREVLSAGR
jgi:hypothetical protein